MRVYARVLIQCFLPFGLGLLLLLSNVCVYRNGNRERVDFVALQEIKLQRCLVIGNMYHLHRLHRRSSFMMMSMMHVVFAKQPNTKRQTLKPYYAESSSCCCSTFFVYK